jgi:DNA-binding transcriptional ArsR family regulator
MDTQRFSKKFKALGHLTRRKIVEHLININSYVCGEVVNIFPYSQSTISQHLKLLKESGIVHGKVESSKTCYCIDNHILDEFKNYISTLNSGKRDEKIT